MSSWQIVLLEPAKIILAKIGVFLVNVLLVVIILIVGWVISKLIKEVAIRLLKSLKVVDELSERIGLEGLLTKGGIKYSLSELIGVIAYWLSVLVTFVVALASVNLITSNLLDRIVSYIPNIILAIFILILGLFIAALLKNIVKTVTSNAGLAQAEILSKVAEVIVIVFSIFIALEQLRIGIKITEITLSIVLGSIGLALALAFGLGCKEIAGKLVNDVLDKIKTKK